MFFITKGFISEVVRILTLDNSKGKEKKLNQCWEKAKEYFGNGIGKVEVVCLSR